MPTKEQILEAAATSHEAKQALEKLFPEYFPDKKITMRDGKFFVGGRQAIYIETGKLGKEGVEFHLDSDFEWRMEKAKYGYQLIPTKK